MKYLKRFVLICFVLTFATNLGAADKMSVFVGILPQKYIVEQVGGDKVSVHVMVPPGKDPHVYEPRPRQISDLSASAIYFSIDMPFEKQLLRKIKDMGMKVRIVDMAANVPKVALEKHLAGQAEAHHHHSEGVAEHEHEDDPDAPDPHIWLSIPLVKIMAANVAAELSKDDPANAAVYKANLESFIRKADEVFARAKSVLAPYKGETLFVYHPAFGYFADDYNLRQYAVETEGKTPSPKELQNLINEARARNARIIFVQPQFDRKCAEAVAKAIDGVVVPMDDLKENILENIGDMSVAVENAFMKRKAK